MLHWIARNAGTLAVGTVLLVVVALVARKLYRDKKQHKSSCGCGCSHCPSAGICHKKE